MPLGALLTPPTTPEKGKRQDNPSSTGTSFTPTQTPLGSWLKDRGAPASLHIEEQISLCDLMSCENIQDKFQEFLNGFPGSSSQEKTKDIVSYARRALLVAKLIPASPPSHLTSWMKERAAMLKLVFSHSAQYFPPFFSFLLRRDLSFVTEELAQSLVAYCTAYAGASRNTITLGIGARFLALQSFVEHDIAPPCNLTWNYLVMSQFVWQETALTHKSVFGLVGMKDQNLQMMVNDDIKQLCALAKKSDSRDAVKGIKVCSFLSCNDLSDPWHSLSSSWPDYHTQYLAEMHVQDRSTRRCFTAPS